MYRIKKMEETRNIENERERERDFPNLSEHKLTQPKINL